ncbi:MAG: hypothetical protein F6K42_14675 [Leptolyngbya sp. SIO1D8]|nr:hypothetical protein [Leptolyngbya sp. SIO1D8]
MQKETYYRKDLRGRNFKGDLRDSNFRFCNLRGCSFRGCNLTGSDFSNSDIRGCDFSDTTLNGTVFKQVKTGRTMKQIMTAFLLGGFLWALFLSNRWYQFIYPIHLFFKEKKMLKYVSFILAEKLFPSTEDIQSSTSINIFENEDHQNEVSSQRIEDSSEISSSANRSIFLQALTEILIECRIFFTLIVGDIRSLTISAITFPVTITIILFKLSVFVIVFCVITIAIILVFFVLTILFHNLLDLSLSIVNLATPGTVLIPDQFSIYLLMTLAFIFLFGIPFGILNTFQVVIFIGNLFMFIFVFLISPSLSAINSIASYVTVEGSSFKQYILENFIIGLYGVDKYFSMMHETRQLYLFLFLTAALLLASKVLQINSINLLYRNFYLDPSKDTYLSKWLVFIEIGHGTSFKDATASNCIFSDSFLEDTNFDGANLENSKFDNTSISFCSYEEANLSIIDWQESRILNCLLPVYFKLNSPIIRKLCIKRNGKNGDFKNCDLKHLFLSGCCLDNASFSGANLSGSVLSYVSAKGANFVEVQALGANFSSADISRADFSGANVARSNFHSAILKSANLVGIQALRVDFSEAILTDVCIDGWGINSYTKFRDVHCERIYLEDGFCEPKPDSGSFQPGDFEKIVVRSNKTLDLFFRDGIDPQAFDFAFSRLKEKHKEAEIESVESWKGGTGIVRVNFQASQADRSSGHQQFFMDYEKLLTTQQQEITKLLQEVKNLSIELAEVNKMRAKLIEVEARLDEKGKHSKFLEGFTYHQASYANLPGKYASHILTEGDFMPNENRKIEISSSGDITGVSGGDITGVVGQENTGIVGGSVEGIFNITLEHLRQSEDHENSRLSEILGDLKAIIQNEDLELSEKEKQKALKHLNSVGELGINRENPSLRERAESAIDALTGILSKGQKLWTTATPLLLAIRKLLGF